jgi:hypothetical protein
MGVKVSGEIGVKAALGWKTGKNCGCLERRDLKPGGGSSHCFAGRIEHRLQARNRGMLVTWRLW